jgi:ABC-type glycerol-3-phosphate transport system substrate-binding protein
MSKRTARRRAEKGEQKQAVGRSRGGRNTKIHALADAKGKSGLGRFLPVMPELVENDPFWLNPEDPHRAAYARQGMVDPTVPTYPVFNPGYAEANAQQIWGAAEADVIREGMTPQAAAEKALKRMGDILAKYPIVES